MSCRGPGGRGERRVNKVKSTQASGLSLQRKKQRIGTEPDQVSSRKEVFQPHLPVRLPCYDLAPITGIALDRALDGYGLQAPQAFMA